MCRPCLTKTDKTVTGTTFIQAPSREAPPLIEQSKGSPLVQTHVLKPISRRQALAYIGAAGASMALSSVAFAGPEEVAARINDITGGAAGDDTLIMLDLPEIAENGNAVKVAFDIDSPMTAENM